MPACVIIMSPQKNEREGGKGRSMEDYNSAYTGFAEVYDKFMDNVPYEEWCTYLTGILKKYGCKDCLLAELGCGTGSLTELLDSAGYDMIGIDNSEEMLEIAMEKRVESGKNILYLLQDMRDFELYGTVGGIVSICDSMNYITEYEDLVQVFRLVNNYLDPGGVFIFDLNTEYKYRELLADRTIAENRDEGSFIWDNYYDEESRINEYDLALFIPAEEADAGKMGEGAGPDCETGAASGSGTSGEGLYRKYQEPHFQRAYTLDEIQKALERAGMEFLTWYDGDGDGRQAPREDSERIYVIAREKGKEV